MICPTCQGEPDQIVSCQRCGGSGIAAGDFRWTATNMESGVSSTWQVTVQPLRTASMNLRPESVLALVAEGFGISIDALVGRSRVGDVVHARKVAMVLIREFSGLSHPAIARYFGGRDHTTVIVSVERIYKLEKEDENVRRQLSELRMALERMREGAA